MSRLFKMSTNTTTLATSNPMTATPKSDVGREKRPEHDHERARADQGHERRLASQPNTTNHVEASDDGCRSPGDA